ncbi:hypothetical protein NDU88_004681 [Pleurodeles waltl]|uniref:Uncharacterized protein n=1 Tax=Pleurodeles waltl TaxID=8319 RepID=A0AAV7TA26_PLEWA|nr:hypothetical protein NDU88_004681 [Pleurodeles waltl]
MSGDALLSAQQSEQSIVHEEPSTSWSAGGFVQEIGIGDELLDFDEVNESEGLVVGREGGLSGQGNNRIQSFGVLQEQRKAAVRSDRHGGESRLHCSSGNLPRDMFQVSIMILPMRHPVCSGGDSVGMHQERTYRRHQFLGHCGSWECEDAGADPAVYSPLYEEKLRSDLV